MGYKQDDSYLLLSGIQHFQFCPRQWAIIHIEQQWLENARTVEGQVVHKNADDPFKREKRQEKLIVRGMPIKSEELNISGQCDVVEFLGDDSGIEIHGTPGLFIPVPVEYKRGKPKMNPADELQLVAQAMCLEEMFLCSVPIGYLFYHETKHRQRVLITDELRGQVRVIIVKMNEYYARRHTPQAKAGPHCKNCSLQDICLPGLIERESVTEYLNRRLWD